MPTGKLETGKMFTFNEIVKCTQGKLMNANASLRICGVSTDSRSLKQGELFIAIKGLKFDGHNFIDKARQQGARALLLNEEWVQANLKAVDKINMPLISVSNSITALSAIAKAHREKFNIPVIAVTGSNGKTTTKEMIAAVLSSRYNVLKSEGSFNNNIGVPLSLLKLNSTYDIAVLELGMNHRGEISSLSEIAKPNIAVITNVAQAHMGNFNSIDDIVEAKCEVLAKLEKDAIAIINVDCQDLYAKAKAYYINLIGFGCKKKGDYQAGNIISAIDGTVFTLNQRLDGLDEIAASGGVKKDSLTGLTFKLHALGEHNVYNALAAIAVADHFGIEAEQIRDKLKNVQWQAMRMQEFDCNGTKIISDCYNANPQSTIAAIETLSKIRQRKRRVLVFGDMLELGEFSVALHQELGAVISRHAIEKLVTVGEQAAHTAQAAADLGKDEKDIYICKTNDHAVKVLIELIEPDDVVLFKASRGMHLEEIINQLRKDNKKIKSNI